MLDRELVDYVGYFLAFAVKVVDRLFDLLFFISGLAKFLSQFVHQLSDVTILSAINLAPSLPCLSPLNLNY